MPPAPPERDTRLSGPEKVFVNGEPYFFKPDGTPRELRTYK